MSWFNKLSSGLKKTSTSLAEVFTKRSIDAVTLEELEELLILSDMGAGVAASITAELSATKVDKEITGEALRELLAAAIAKRLAAYAVPLLIPPPLGGRLGGGRNDTPSLPNNAPLPASPLKGEEKPTVVLVVGVNGNGKTTTIGKLAHRLAAEGKKITIVAADTFRAAAVEQLQVWATRSGAQFVRGAENADPASVAYQGVEQALANGSDVVFIDTAGRLHTKDDLMAELGKILKVIRKLVPEAPHHVLQVLDATTGQNALAQVKAFREVAGVTGLIVTKLDGTAKAGIILALAEQFHLPIHAIGVGEGAEDLQPFAADDFARALVGL
jgi:fused signal recognition particle receptor